MLDRYEVLFNKLEAVVSSLEQEQIQKSIGMTKSSNKSPDERAILRDLMKKLIQNK